MISNNSFPVVPSAPQGRLTLTTGTAVPTVSVSAATTVFYTPTFGRFVPLWDGTGLVMTDTGGELNQATTDTTKSPAAVIGNSNYDVFVWNDATTIRATRGPPWSIKQTFTVTIATPAVVTQTAHGLSSGMTWTPTTSGALPTGLTAGTDYYVTVLSSSTFNVSTTLANQVAGTLVATSGSQSGTHTGENRTTVRGTGAGTTEIDFTTALGIPLNKNAITNGPAAGRGTFIGTIWSNGSSTIDMNFGSRAANGGMATLGVWNCYNQAIMKASVSDSTPSWSYTSTTVRAANASSTNRIQFVSGLAQQAILASYNDQLTLAATAAAWGAIGLALDSPSSFDFFALATNSAAVANVFATPTTFGMYTPQIGFHYLQATEDSDGTHATTYAGSNMNLLAMFMM